MYDSRATRMGWTRCAVSCALLLSMFTSFLTVTFLLAHFMEPIKTLYFAKEQCYVEKTLHVTQYRCTCGFKCNSLYPCIVAYATVNSSAAPAELKGYPLWLFLNDWQYINSMRRVNEDKCFMEMCHPNFNDNRDAVELYRTLHLAVGHHHTCYYDANHPKRGAFIEHRVSSSLVIHVVLWPLVSLVAATLMLCILFHRWRNQQRDVHLFEEIPSETTVETLERY